VWEEQEGEVYIINALEKDFSNMRTKKKGGGVNTAAAETAVTAGTFALLHALGGVDVALGSQRWRRIFARRCKGPLTHQLPLQILFSSLAALIALRYTVIAFEETPHIVIILGGGVSSLWALRCLTTSVVEGARFWLTLEVDRGSFAVCRCLTEKSHVIHEHTEVSIRKLLFICDDWEVQEGQGNEHLV
jgi:hypothetical protein